MYSVHYEMYTYYNQETEQCSRVISTPCQLSVLELQDDGQSRVVLITVAHQQLLTSTHKSGLIQQRYFITAIN